MRNTLSIYTQISIVIDVIHKYTIPRHDLKLLMISLLLIISLVHWELHDRPMGHQHFSKKKMNICMQLVSYLQAMTLFHESETVQRWMRYDFSIAHYIMTS